jgi:hypothetical protein
MKKFYLYLSYTGTLPFLFCALCFIEGIQIIPFLGSIYKVMSGNGLVIASFMAGSHWGLHLRLSGKWAIYLPVFSNVNATLLWGGFIFLSFKDLLIGFILTFIVLLLIDRKLFLDGLINREYFRVRCSVSLIVISSLTLSVIYV